ncbi:MAG: RNA-binding transcriptional accessory protein, partial [Deltaproteobacteria bacterium]|nr:RNA-binding transcriptional accessory protein [Deltaproteobacteria bacterium]
MIQKHIEIVSQELKIAPSQVLGTVNLLNEGGTVPFIARYRKERTGGLDEVQVIAIRDRMKALAELTDRLEAIIKSLNERGLITGELEARLRSAESLAKLEDIYLPFRPKRQTRGAIAKEKGLGPLASEIMAQPISLDPMEAARRSIESGAKAETPEGALAMARDIIAEWVSEDETARERLRNLYSREAMVVSRVKAGMEEEAQKFRDYFDFSEKASSIPSHRYLAVRRAEASGFFIVQIQPDPGKALAILRNLFVKNDSLAAAEVDKALADSYKRLASLSMETETRLATKKRADQEAIGYFSQNLRDLLMAPPLRGKPVLAIDPGFRTGCKAVALSADGTPLGYATIQPHASEVERQKARQEIMGLMAKGKSEVVAVGNG